MISLKLLRYCSLGAVFFVLSCATPQMVNLDPITVIENMPGSNIYRGSYTRTTDIINTKLDLSFDWDSAYVYGKATISAKPYFYDTDQLVLDANGFQIKQVSLIQNEDKKPLKYFYDGKKLRVNLDKTYHKNQVYSVFIDYVAMPNKLKIGKDIGSAGDRGIYFINNTGRDKNKPQQIWTQGETECNSTWFPTINDPQEKMTQELNITVPDRFISLSNGSLEFSSLNGDGTRTDSWRQEQAHSTYLTMLAVGDFVITKDQWRDKEVNYYTEPEFAPTAKIVFGNTPEMMEFFSNRLGVDYPWDKYSQIVVRDFVSGAMENTSASVFYEGLNMTEGQHIDQNQDGIIAHELFHHWFGDLVTAESWSNLPLNESFATYGEYLWDEYKHGRDQADFNGLNDLNSYLKSGNKKRVDVIRFDYADREHMFDEVSYEKGGRILHMLRKTVGDEAFFKALNIYLTRFAFKSAEIHDLRLIFEEISGTDLNWFFNQWFLASGHPILNIKSAYDSDNKEVTVSIEQSQDLSNTPLYRIPMALDIYLNGKVERKEILLEKQSQKFVFSVSGNPDLVNVDAEKYLLAEKIEDKTTQEYVFQYHNAPLFMDRLEAVNVLSKNRHDEIAKSTLIKAINDKHWFIRLNALELIQHLATEERTIIYEKIKELALQDDVSQVRALAVEILGKYYRTMDNREIFFMTAMDKSIAVKKATSAAAAK
ncbi:M1 family aminopeptidase [Daejeonella sp.]|uniref:M1 family metallopeptidase n=1 Tax=Daejeonella sp. TaxID=2805397 RepID=UPI0025C28F1F|nr:M1 family aminopeptidase [Daejeonella sp.]